MHGDRHFDRHGRRLVLFFLALIFRAQLSICFTHTYLVFSPQLLHPEVDFAEFPYQRRFRCVYHSVSFNSIIVKSIRTNLFALAFISNSIHSNKTYSKCCILPQIFTHPPAGCSLLFDVNSHGDIRNRRRRSPNGIL